MFLRYVKIQSDPVITSLKGLTVVCVVITEVYNVTFDSEELTGATEYLTL